MIRSQEKIPSAKCVRCEMATAEVPGDARVHWGPSARQAVYSQGEP